MQTKNNKKHCLEDLQKYLQYNSNSGIFSWIKKTGAKAVVDKFAGRSDKDGYIVIQFKQKKYFAHRLAWLFAHGEWPKNCIDHVNGIRSDHRIENLRDVSKRENSSNKQSNRSGKLQGCSYSKNAKKWHSRIWINNKNKHLGYFYTEIEAHNAYNKFCKENNL